MYYKEIEFHDVVIIRISWINIFFIYIIDIKI